MTTRRMPLMDISNNDGPSATVATDGRRKSGRAVRAPEKFIPDAQTSQSGTTSAKRKRGGEHAEKNASEDEEDQDDDSDGISDESAAEEEVIETRRKAKTAKKPVAKKAKVNGTLSHKAAPAVTLPNRPKKTKKVAIADENAEGLYAEVFSSGDSSDDVASQWLTRYEADNPAAMTDLVNFVLKSAGCDIQVSEDDINDPENVEGKLGDLQEEYQAQNITDYPLISKAKSSYVFRDNLVGFFNSLIATMHQSEVMYEEVALIENIHLWVATMSSSTLRPFRHTATVIALTITSAMCHVALAQVEAAAKTLRQLESEKKKKGANKARLADFQKKVTAGEKHKEFLEAQMKDFFDTVYVHRYRDVDPKIRTECVEALGHWILTLKNLFFEGTYLRYMGWMLSDTHPAMRHEVVKQLGKILKNPGYVGGMRHFIERFRPRLIEIATRDSDPNVRSSAVDLMYVIREAGMLEPDDIDVIGKLIFDSEPKVRKAVVAFFAESITELSEAKTEELGGEEALDEILTADEEEFDSPRAEWIKLKSLAEILLSYDSEDQEEMPGQIDIISVDFSNLSGSESRFTFAAQALYSNLPEIKDWEMLAGYLLFDHSSKSTRSETERALKESFKPNEREEIILLEILNIVVKLSVTQPDDSERAKDKSRKKHAKTEALEAQESTARRLANLIPKLLKKFGANPKTATVVLRLEHILNLGVFQELRQDSTAYAKLLDEISSQFSGHADKRVLSEAGAAFLHARGFEELEEVTESKMQSLWEDTTSTLRRINKAGEIAVRGSFRVSVLTELSNNLARLDKLASISSCVEPLETESDVDEPLPINILLDVVARGVLQESDPDRDALEDDVVLSAIRSSMFYFMWKARSLTDTVSSGNDISSADIDGLRELQETFTTNLVAALSSRASLDPVRLLATGTLLDLYVLFATLRPATNTISKNGDAAMDADSHAYLQTLVREIGPEVQTELTAIFDSTEKQFAKRGKKRLAEPGDDEAPEDLDSEAEDDEEEDITDSERRSDILKAEQQLCELTGKLVLAILSKAIDASGPLKGKLRSRIQRNRTRLGPNFKEVVAYLDEAKPKKKIHKSKSQQAADAAKKAGKSKEVVDDEDEEEDDPFADVEPEEGTAEDLRRRELQDDDPPVSVNEEGENGDDAPVEDDDVLGD